MNQFEGISPEVLNPPAVVVQAFDEVRALVEIQEAVARRDEAKGEFKDAISVVGRKLIEARRAMPDVPSRGSRGHLTYSPAFLAFIEKTGLTKSTARHYMSYVRNPKTLEKQRNNALCHGGTGRRRRRLLTEVLDLLTKAPDLNTAIAVVREEINEIK